MLGIIHESQSLAKGAARSLAVLWNGISSSDFSFPLQLWREGWRNE
jgi:hypothetical protein